MNDTGSQKIFVDRFHIPAAAVPAFTSRMNENRKFIRTLAGFLDDRALYYFDPEGNMICLTLAYWENESALAKAKEAVRAEYQRVGFDPAAFLSNYGIRMERETYQEFTGF